MKRTMRFNVICAIAFGLIAILFQVLFSIVTSMTSQMFLLIATSLIMLAPFAVNIITIRRFDIDRVSRFIVSDLLYVILPVCVMSAASEAIVSQYAEIRLTDGIGTLIIMSVLLIEAIIFWPAYYIVNKLS